MKKIESNGTEEPQITTRSLRYDFSAVEIHDFSLQLAADTQRIAALEKELKSMKSDFGAKIDCAKSSVNKLSNFISNGYEYREVECSVEYHKPSQGKKTLTRKDTKEKIIEKMEQFEWNLFNQSDEELFDEKKYAKSII